VQKRLWEPEHDPAVERAIYNARIEENIEAAAFRKRMHDAFLIARNAALVLDWNMERAL
jgi:hypothetical protein